MDKIPYTSNISKYLYIGKSNKRFTHNKIYKYFQYLKDDKFIYTYVIDNKNSIVHFIIEHDNFYKKFKIIDSKEVKSIERKNKLKKINNERKI